MAVHRFERVLVDSDRFELRLDGRPIRVQRIVLETLLYLINSGGRVVSRRDLARGPWRGLKVSDGAISRAIMLARRAIGDDSASQIVTVHGVGYRLAAEVTQDAPMETLRVALNDQRFNPNPPLPRLELGSSPLFGRDHELAMMQTLFARARAGEAQLLTICGSAGIGKTALIERFVQHTIANSAIVAWGRCWNARSAPPLLPWLEIMRASQIAEAFNDAGCQPSPQWDELKSVVGALTATSATSRGPDGLLHGHLTAPIAGIFQELSQTRPVVLVIEDLDAADRASLALLRYLCLHMSGEALLVVATVRSAEVFSLLSQELGGFAGHARLLELEGISPEAVKMLIRSLDRSIDDDHAEAIGRITGGNPLFVKELARADLSARVAWVSAATKGKQAVPQGGLHACSTVG